MDNRQSFQDRLQVELKDFGSKVDALRARAEKAEASAQEKYRPLLADLASRMDQARGQLETILAATDDAFGELRTGAEKSWVDLKAAFEKAAKTFETDVQKRSTSGGASASR